MLTRSRSSSTLFEEFSLTFLWPFFFFTYIYKLLWFLGFYLKWIENLSYFPFFYHFIWKPVLNHFSFNLATSYSFLPFSFVFSLPFPIFISSPFLLFPSSVVMNLSNIDRKEMTFSSCGLEVPLSKPSSDPKGYCERYFAICWELVSSSPEGNHVKDGR